MIRTIIFPGPRVVINIPGQNRMLRKERLHKTCKSLSIVTHPSNLHRMITQKDILNYYRLSGKLHQFGKYIYKYI